MNECLFLPTNFSENASYLALLGEQSLHIFGSRRQIRNLNQTRQLSQMSNCQVSELIRDRSVVCEI